MKSILVREVLRTKQLSFNGSFRLGERVLHPYDGRNAGTGLAGIKGTHMFGSSYDPRFPIPEMKTANEYIKRLGWLGSKLLALFWGLSTVKVSASVLVGILAAAGLYVAYIGTDYRRAFPRISASLTKAGLLRLFIRAWPAFVAFVIVGGLVAGKITWQQLGEFKTALLGLAAIPFASSILKTLFGD